MSDRAGITQAAPTLLTASRLTKSFSKGRPHKLFSSRQEDFLAVDTVSLEIARGRTLGIVGESGSGKSTLAKMLVGLESPTSGSAAFDGLDLIRARGVDRRRLQREIQMVPQDPYTAMNPRFSVFDVLTEPWRIHMDVAPPRASWRDRASHLLEQVGLQSNDLDRYPQQFSGGQQQRISLARSLALEPKLIICDEVLSALDASVQAQVLRLLVELKSRLEVTFLFISHDLAVVRDFADDLAIMYRGSVVESGPTARVFAEQQHEYTQLLLSSVLSIDINGWPMSQS